MIEIKEHVPDHPDRDHQTNAIHTLTEIVRHLHHHRRQYTVLLRLEKGIPITWTKILITTKVRVGHLQVIQDLNIITAAGIQIMSKAGILINVDLEVPENLTTGRQDVQSTADPVMDLVPIRMIIIRGIKKCNIWERITAHYRNEINIISVV